jgi:transcriptional regulator with XRE-family HTH domain
MQIVNPDQIRAHRAAAKHSLRRLAEMCGRNSRGEQRCTYEAIRNWENGTTPTIPEEIAVRLSQILGLPMSSVFRPAEDIVLPTPTDPTREGGPDHERS